MRLFVAIEPQESVVRHLQKMQEILRPLIPARWTLAEQLHLTLKFLGDTEDRELPSVIAALKGVHIEPAISLRICGVLCFPPHGPIHIVGAAMEDEGNRCAHLAEEIDRACHEAGFPLEGRRWTPHVTLGRVKERVDPDARAKLASVAISNLKFAVDEFVLKESRLTDKGATYSTLATFS